MSDETQPHSFCMERKKPVPAIVGARRRGFYRVVARAPAPSVPVAAAFSARCYPWFTSYRRRARRRAPSTTRFAASSPRMYGGGRHPRSHGVTCSSSVGSNEQQPRPLSLGNVHLSILSSRLALPLALLRHLI